jgi:hypothetical protein
VRVFNAAVQKTITACAKSSGLKSTPEKCNQIYGENTWLHDDTTNAFKEYLVEKRAAAT